MIRLAHPSIGQAEKDAVARVLASGMLAQGPEVAAFEEEFSSIVEGRQCIAVNSGTSALHLSLLAAGIGPGDEVIVPSFTFAATANAVRLCGADVVFADIEPDTYGLAPRAVEAALTPRTAAILPVHLYGHPANMGALGRIADRHGLLVVEDAAQAHAAALDGRAVGTFGHLAAFSFYPTKNMTTGEGGMVVTDDADLARRVRLLRNQGMEARYQNEVVGLNNRMTDIGAAIGRVQLTRLAGWNEQRRSNAEALSRGLVGVDVPTVGPGVTHVYHQYTVRCRDRATLSAHLESAGVQSDVYYPVPVHRLPSFGLDLDLPETERAAAEVLSLPVHPGLSREGVDRIVEVVSAARGKGA